MENHMKIDCSKVMTPVRAAGTCARILVFVAAMTSCLGAQSKTASPPTAVMLKRIAEAVDGNRSGRQVYVVLSGEQLSPPVGVYYDPKAAQAAANGAGKGAQVFGPYQTELDPGANVAACVHVTGSRWHTDRCVPPAQTVRWDDVRGLSLQITRMDGKRDSIPLPPNADAVFLSMASIDKFAVPYYTRMLGLPAATAMRQEAERSFVPTSSKR